MKTSIITPLYEPGNPYILATYQSLKSQSLQEWLWIIGENNGGKVPDEIRKDNRVTIIRTEGGNIGKLKGQLSANCQTDVIVELDHDDLLTPDALNQVVTAFNNSTVDFVYSDFAEFTDFISDMPITLPMTIANERSAYEPRKGYPYSERYGWQHYEVEYDGHKLVAMRAPEVTAHNIRLIEWCPNHVRAWRKATYEKIGGHNPNLKVGDDHDLIVRFYLANAQFVHIPECLYLYRVHANNTVKTNNAAIRRATNEVYNQYLWQLAEKWCTDNGLMRIDLCGNIDPQPGYVVLDKRINPQVAGIPCDLDEHWWPIGDNSVGILRAHDALEHLLDPIHTMNEAWRILAPGGWFMILVPSSQGKGAFCDPTHVSYWNNLSFDYYTNPDKARYIPEFKGKFQVSRVLEYFPSEWHKENNVPYVAAHLFAVKPGYRAMGEMLWRI